MSKYNKYVVVDIKGDSFDEYFDSFQDAYSYGEMCWCHLTAKEFDKYFCR